MSSTSSLGFTTHLLGFTTAGLAAIALLAPGCGGSEGSTPLGAAASTGSATTSAGQGGGATGTGSQSSSSSTATTGQGGATTGSGGGGGQGGSGSSCSPNEPCGPTDYCDYADDLCGNGNAKGTCAPRPAGCPDVEIPTCACDGVVYGNGCDAQASGQDVSASGGCTPDPGMFSCGYIFCSLASQYCSITPNDTPDPPPAYYGCGDLPPACDLVNVPTCECAAEAVDACFGTCSIDPSGGVVIHCAGG